MFAHCTLYIQNADALPPAAAPIVPPLNDAERQAIIDEMVAAFDFEENPGNEEVSDDDEPHNDGTIYDEVSELGHLTYSEFQELCNLRAEVIYRRTQESLYLQESVLDDDNIYSAPL